MESINEQIDAKENSLLKLDFNLLSILLKDHSTDNNIIWATSNYEEKGISFFDEITVQKITGRNGNIIKPRVEKSKAEQARRIKEKGEVFTPSWVCNMQNNLGDNNFLGYDGAFNTECNKSWKTNNNKIQFINKTWQEYVLSKRIEISCGEAPYLVSRYDTSTGKIIPIKDRIGLLDRKIRVVNENVTSDEEWLYWVEKAFKSIYGYEWQGDNLLIARENLLYTYIDYYYKRFNIMPSIDKLVGIATIISWNIFQMDGLKGVIPNSCKNEVVTNLTLFGEETVSTECNGCKKDNIRQHNGIYAYTMDWDKNKKVKFVTLIKNRSDKYERNN